MVRVKHVAADHANMASSRRHLHIARESPAGRLGAPLRGPVLTDRLEDEIPVLVGDVPVVKEVCVGRIRAEQDVVVAVALAAHSLHHSRHAHAGLPDVEPVGMVDVPPEQGIAVRARCAIDQRRYRQNDGSQHYREPDQPTYR